MIFCEKCSIIGPCIYFVKMTQEAQAEELDVDQAMSQLLAEQDQPLLPSRAPVVPVNAPRKRQLRCPLAKRNLDLVPRETTMKRKKVIKARERPTEMRTQEENVNESIKPMFSHNYAYLSVGD